MNWYLDVFGPLGNRHVDLGSKKQGTVEERREHTVTRAPSPLDTEAMAGPGVSPNEVPPEPTASPSVSIEVEPGEPFKLSTHLTVHVRSCLMNTLCCLWGPIQRYQAARCNRVTAAKQTDTIFDLENARSPESIRIEIYDIFTIKEKDEQEKEKVTTENEITTI
ncbi:uncharacterized protein LOC106702042 [Latimeria chalumnae]|uniref:uncharacterized protein LOC106702042 n=1 Tax=Latimeria chalumnae TaxID=7897 RepID=UPI00313CE6F2